MMHSPLHRGFTLLISLVLTSVVLAVGVALLDIAYKQILLASSAKQSQYAFYNADSALECALFYDQKLQPGQTATPFAYIAPADGEDFMECDNRSITGYATGISGGRRETTFTLSCPSGGESGEVTVYKYNPSDQREDYTFIYANGFSSCDADNQRSVERGVRASY